MDKYENRINECDFKWNKNKTNIFEATRKAILWIMFECTDCNLYE